MHFQHSLWQKKSNQMYRVCVWSSAGSASWQLSLCCLSGTAGTGSRWDFLINCHFCLRGYSTHAYKIVIKATDNSTSVTARSKFLISIPLQPLLPCCPLEYFSQRWLVHCHLKCNVPEAVAARSLPCFSGYHFFLWFIFKRFFFFFNMPKNKVLCKFLRRSICKAL